MIQATFTHITFKGLRPLSKKQAEIMIYLIRYIRKNGFSPTFAEMARNTGFQNTGTIYGHVLSLINKGYLYQKKKNKTGLTLTEATEGIPPRYIKKKLRR